MTLREKFSKQFPDYDITEYCPSDFNWCDDPPYCAEDMDTPECSKCWDREVPSTADTVKQAAERMAARLKDAASAPIIVNDSEEKVTPIILDSGDRTEFESGAVRDMREGKGRCDLMPLEVVARLFPCLDEELHSELDPILDKIADFERDNDTNHLLWALSRFAARAYNYDGATMLLEVAKHFEEGAKKYGPDNWRRGIPVYCYIDSAVRHYLKWLRGDKDEPHDRAFVWNLMCCIWEVDYHKEAK